MQARTPEERREYQRRYRAAKKETVPEIVARHAELLVDPALETRLHRQRVEKKRVDPFKDGWADWPELVQGMDQHQIDVILNHPAIRTSRRD